MASAFDRQSPARPTPSSAVMTRPLGLGASAVKGGFWAERQEANANGAISSGLERLEAAGNLHDLRLAAGLAEGVPTGPVYSDSDVYKWLESVAWEYARSPNSELLGMQSEVTKIIAAAQEDDGYLDSVVALRYGREGRYQKLQWSHEHYCAGHLIQAAVAQVRCTGDGALLEVAVKLADHLVATFGRPGNRDIDGHPVVEMALVELFRETGNRTYLQLAQHFIDARGHGLTQGRVKDPAYFSDRVPVRQAITVEGHAVRALYLAAGAADVAIEMSDPELLATLDAQFWRMWATKTYLTGGLGSRWEGEAFGDDYELPSDRAYAETCAAVGGIQWAWRMLLATGDPRYADATERMLFNGFLAGVSLNGSKYFYVNPLQLRKGAYADKDRSAAHGRQEWFECACCPPNMMRTFASLAGYLASTTTTMLYLHQYASSTLDNGKLHLDVSTNYPRDGFIRITVLKAQTDPTGLALRIPAWAGGAQITVNADPHPAPAGTYVEIWRHWAESDVIELQLPMAPRLTEADPRIDGARGCVAVERGPLVYALEQVDQIEGTDLDDLEILTGSISLGDYRDDLLGGVTPIHLTARSRPHAQNAWPYRAAASHSPQNQEEANVDLVAIPYYAWANRGATAMRVWLLTAERASSSANAET